MVGQITSFYELLFTVSNKMSNTAFRISEGKQSIFTSMQKVIRTIPNIRPIYCDEMTILSSLHVTTKVAWNTPELDGTSEDTGKNDSKLATNYRALHNYDRNKYEFNIYITIGKRFLRNLINKSTFSTHTNITACVSFDIPISI